MDQREAEAVLQAHGQDHVLRFLPELDAAERAALFSQIERVDWETVALAKAPHHDIDKKISPLPAMELPEVQARYDSDRRRGEALIRDGKAACVLLAGGMGTRLGLDRPKGELDIGITHQLFLFEQLIHNLLEVSDRVPLYIMTSEKNDAETRRFFREHGCFGYPAELVKFFVQDMAPAVDYDGKLLLEGKGRLATSPNGNGGWFSSMAGAGYLDELHDRGTEWLNVFSVDNPLQRMCDPAFLGATAASGADCGSKVVRKNDPHEKMGVVCLEDGRPGIIEYYELTEEMASARSASGSLLYGFGVILNYFFRVSALERIMQQKLPVHIVEKKIPYVDAAGNPVRPTEPNGYKFENLVVDMIGLLDGMLPYEVVREKEFAPIKNLHGTDSLDSARELLTENGIRL